MAGKRLYIATRDPVVRGGIMEMASFVYDLAEEEGYDPCLVYNILDYDVDVYCSDLLARDYTRAVDHTTVHGMEAKGIPRVLPYFECSQFLTNRGAWIDAVQDADVCFCVDGWNQSALPFLLAGKPFGVWVASTHWAQRKPRLRAMSFLRRWRDRLSKPVMEFLEGRIYRRADIIYTHSDHTRDLIRDRYGVDEDRLETVPAPIDTTFFSPDGEKEGEDDADTLTVLAVARLSDARKNIPLLIEAFADVHDQMDDTKLVLVGGEPTPELQRRVEQHGVVDAVEFVDYVPKEELPRYYRAADAFAIASWQEGGPTVGMEAMACGTPVVATRCGGPETFVQEGDNGFLVPLNDAEAMADALHRILSDDTLRDRLGAQAREDVVEHYSVEALRGRFVEAFDALAGREEA